MKRFWVLGPVDVNADGKYWWGVVDVRDIPGQHIATKPLGFVEFWQTEELANTHRDVLNDHEYG